MDSKIVDLQEVGQRLDVFMQNYLNCTRSHASNLINEGHVLVGGRKVKCGYKLRLNDEILYEILQPTEIDASADESVQFEIVYEDADLLVINKPQGLVVHPCESTKSGTLVNGLLAKVDNLSGINGKIRPGIVHRLDKDTSGLMLVAKNDLAHNNLAKQIETKACKRKYFALLEGRVKEEEFEIDTYICRDKKDRKKMAVCQMPEGKQALSICKVITRYEKYTLCEFELKTGRTHQIRVHAKHISHPVVGDKIYNKNEYSSLLGQLLHSHYISFCHPRSGEAMEFDVALPIYFQQFLSKLK